MFIDTTVIFFYKKAIYEKINIIGSENLTFAKHFLKFIIYLCLFLLLGNPRSFTFTEEILNGKLHFLCSTITFINFIKFVLSI